MYKKAHFGVLERTVKLTNIYALENKYYIKIFSMLFVLPPNEFIIAHLYPHRQ